MNSQQVDEAIGRYVDARMVNGKDTARERFLSYAYLKCRREELLEFMRRTYALSRYQIDFCQVMGNPLKGPEFAWLAALFAVGIFACLLISCDEYRFYGVILSIAVPANIYSLLKVILKKRCELQVLEAIYREIADMAQQEAEQLV